jgi:hypothetical protein
VREGKLDLWVDFAEMMREGKRVLHLPIPPKEEREIPHAKSIALKETEI